MRRKWGRWASRTCLFLCAISTISGDTELQLVLVTSGGIQGGGEEEDVGGEEGTSAPKKAPPQEKFLEKTSDDLWALGPLPARGSVRSMELGVALHTYVTQQWSMVFFYPF